jgi:hypothetical protein
MSKLRKPLSIDLVKVKQVQVRSRRNLRSHTSMFVFFFTGVFLANLVVALFDSGRSPHFSPHTLPVWIAVAIATPMFVLADTLAVLSLAGNSAESTKNRRCVWAFALTITGYAILIIVFELTK